VTLRQSGSCVIGTVKPWFWLVMITPPLRRCLHRMVGTVVAELHLSVLRAAGQRQQLVPEADTEQRNLPFHNFLRSFDGVAAGAGIAGPLEKNTPSGS
jgi:hypothetical protein